MLRSVTLDCIGNNKVVVGRAKKKEEKITMIIMAGHKFGGFVRERVYRQSFG